MKYYTKISDVYTARQWHGQEIPGVSVRNDKGFIHTGNGLEEVNNGDYIVKGISGRPFLVRKAQFEESFRLIREDDYEDDSGQMYADWDESDMEYIFDEEETEVLDWGEPVDFIEDIETPVEPVEEENEA